MHEFDYLSITYIRSESDENSESLKPILHELSLGGDSVSLPIATDRVSRGQVNVIGSGTYSLKTDRTQHVRNTYRFLCVCVCASGYFRLNKDFAVEYSRARIGLCC